MREKVVILGSSGQLGSELGFTLRHNHSHMFEVIDLPRSIDLLDKAALEAEIKDIRPRWLINSAALTNVDLAEEDSVRAFQTNAIAAGWVASACAGIGCRSLFISTEAVFAGTKKSAYKEGDSRQPVSVYGSSKAAGEDLALIFGHDSIIVRTSWLYGKRGGTNFPTRILAQLESSEEQIKVVGDIFGNPTPTSVLAEAICGLMLEKPSDRVFNVAARGVCSKFEWAQEIAKAVGFQSDRVLEVSSVDFVTAARRPQYVDLDVSRIESLLGPMPLWSEAFRTHFEKAALS